MVAGRPREHNREQIAIDIIEWARKDDSINLNKFCAWYEPPIPPTNLAIWANQCQEFRKAYDTAKAFIAYRREERLNENGLHVKAYDLNATVYDLLMREERRLQAEFEASLKAQEVQQGTEEQNNMFKELMNQLASNRSSAKMPDSTNNNDNKS